MWYSIQCILIFGFHFWVLYNWSWAETWDGKLLTTVSNLMSVYCRYGDIESIRVLHERFCAFVNFRNADMAARAMEKLNVSSYLFSHM